LNGILETAKRILHESKILKITYKVFPPPFHEKVLEKCVHAWYELMEHNGGIVSHIEAKRMGLREVVPARTEGYSFVIRRGTRFGDKLRGTRNMPRINSRKKIFLKPLHRYWRKFFYENN